MSGYRPLLSLSGGDRERNERERGWILTVKRAPFGVKPKNSTIIAIIYGQQQLRREGGVSELTD